MEHNIEFVYSRPTRVDVFVYYDEGERSGRCFVGSLHKDDKTWLYKQDCRGWYLTLNNLTDIAKEISSLVQEAKQ